VIIGRRDYGSADTVCCTVTVIPLPLPTSRLVVEMMRSQHAEAFMAYRNDPDVARFQDWAVPFTEEMARRLIDEQDALEGPADGRWVQLAVLRDGVLIGDVAVGVDDLGRQAMIGYSIATAEQGNGYATEAVTAVVGTLFEAPGMHRVSASIDPANHASRRVLDKLGFRHEGRAIAAVLVRGEWADDDRYALLATEWHGLTTRDGPR
jgi:RimJ/RimL family protein N-acetyltransferase